LRTSATAAGEAADLKTEKSKNLRTNLMPLAYTKPDRRRTYLPEDTLMSKLTYRTREDGQKRASIPVWLHLTEEQVHAVEKRAASAGYSRWRRFLRDIAENATEHAITSQGR
jgi:hypothetical protein